MAWSPPVLWHNTGGRVGAKRHQYRYGTAFGALAMACLLGCGGCSAGEVTLEVIIPEEAEDLSRRVELVDLTLFSEQGEEVSSRRFTGLEEVELAEVEPGTWSFELTAMDGLEQVLLQGLSFPLEVTRRGEVEARVLLAPVERIIDLPVYNEIEVEELSRRCDLSAVAWQGAERGQQVLITGGRVEGEPSLEAWIYDPAQLDFMRISSMHCPRAGHEAAAVELDSGEEVVVIVGGGDAECFGVGPGRTSANTIEVYNESERRFEVFDAEWTPPSLATASVARLASGRAMLAAADSIWILDLTENDSRPYAGAAIPEGRLRTVSLTDTDAVAILGGTGAYSTLDLYATGEFCERTRNLDLAPTGNSITAFPWGGVFVSRDDRWWSFRSSGCGVGFGHSEGTLSPRRSGHTSTALTDGRVLLVGGREDEGDETSLFLPLWSRNNRTPTLHPGPPSRHTLSGHATVALDDGTALILGCGEPPEIFNPERRSQELASDFSIASRPEDEPALRVVMGIDASPEAGRFIRQKAIASTPSMVLAEWGIAGVDPEGNLIEVDVVDVGVIPTALPVWEEDRECPGILPVPPWSHPEGEPTFLTATATALASFTHLDDADSIARRIAVIDDEESYERVYGPRCEVQQPAKLLTTLDGIDPGEGVLEVSDYPGALLVVLQMGTDDQSQDQLCEGDAPRPPFCQGDESWLLDPEAIVRLVRSVSEEDHPFEVVVIWDDGNGETCPIPARLTRFVHALGDDGVFYSACTREPEEISTFLLSRTKALTFRSACLPAEVVDASTCRVSMSYLDEQRGVQRRIVEQLERGEDWSVETDALACDGASLIRLSHRLEHPEDLEAIFERFEYVCW